MLLATTLAVAAAAILAAAVVPAFWPSVLAWPVIAVWLPYFAIVGAGLAGTALVVSVRSRSPVHRGAIFLSSIVVFHGLVVSGARIVAHALFPAAPDVNHLAYATLLVTGAAAALVPPAWSGTLPASAAT